MGGGGGGGGGGGASTTPTIGLAASLKARADQQLKTVTLIESVTYIGVACESPGLTNCRGSLRRTHEEVSTKTLVTVVPLSSTAVFPISSGSVVSEVISFGTNIKSVLATTGSPSSFVSIE